MRSRRDDDLTSFELLLDTMCNAFGGIVFIALLLAILSQAIEVNPPKEAELPLPSPPPSSLSSNIVSIMDKEQLIRLSNILEADQRRIELAEESVRSLEKRIASLDQDIAELQHQQQRTLRFPRLHAIEKQPVFIAVKNGKLYPISDLSAPFSGRRGYDMSQIRMWEKGNSTTIDPIPEKGQAIDADAEKMGKLRAALTNIDPAEEYISFAVFPDSFGEFHRLKTMFLDRGFDYNWLIIRDELSIVRGKSRGGNGMHHVQ